MDLTIAFTLTLILSIALTDLVRRFALARSIVDRPDQERKTHARPIPLLGGAAIFLSFFTALFFVRDSLVAGDLEYRHWLGFAAGALVIMIGGVLDDIYSLRPGRQFIFPVLASLCVILGGVEIGKITNPFGGYLFFSQLASSAVVFTWLLGMMYTTKLLDGVDGLVGGIGAIGAVVIFLFTQSAKYYQPDISLAALVLAAAILGFLAFNWHPAKIFLGEGGSLLIGYALGVLSIISGGKIAIALLVMGIPIMDTAWTIIRRLRQGKNPFRISDRKHLHFRLQDTGLGPRRTVLVYYFLSAAFGLSALFLQSRGKLFAISLLAAIMLGFILFFDRKESR